MKLKAISQKRLIKSIGIKLTQHKGRRQIIHVRNESWDIISDSIGIRMVIKE